MSVQPTESLRAHLLWLGQIVEAEAISLFVPSEGSSQSSLLVHGDTQPAVPELETSSSARACRDRFDRLLDSTQMWTASKAARLRSRLPNGLLICLPFHWPVEGKSAPAVAGAPLRRRSDQDPTEPAPPRTVVLVGLRLSPDSPLLDSCDETTPVGLEAHDPGEVPTARTCLLALLSTVAPLTQQASTAVEDPVSGLPGRPGLLATLDSGMRTARRTGKPLSLLLLNPDDFYAINDRFGREAGDDVMREVALRLKRSLRLTDRTAKYGGAIFAAILEETPLAEGRVVAEKSVRELGEAAYLGGAARLGFSAGIAGFEPGESGVDGALDLIRRADQALFAAKRAGGGQAMSWQKEWKTEQVGNLDRLSGIFTGNSTKDYRNMALLLDTIGVIAATPDLQGLSDQVVESLFVRLRPERVAIFDASPDGRLDLLTGLVRRGGSQASSKLREVFELDTPGMTLVKEALQRRGPIRRVERIPTVEDSGPDEVLRCAVPLVAGEAVLGCLYFDGNAQDLGTDTADLIFLKALASQLAVAADRAHLANLEQIRQEQERKRLQRELSDLRRALQEAKLVYRSPRMEELLAVARRVAPTDATVLILGESGTGKELVARAVHEISPRHKKSLLVVDCAAIPSNLIESELFGHERGAFTGADRRKVGRLVEAAGSTVVLDEIAELPLEVQSRLLRFVQEKQLTPVGGVRSQSVDVRVIASTNRDLAAEVAAGRFREDLYHRLNVVRLVVAPLRKRPEDILHLAEHFRQIYGLLYRKDLRFTPEAEALLLQYDWPGNVRELQNCIMQAAILSEEGEIDGADLGLPFSAEVPSSVTSSTDPLGSSGTGLDRSVEGSEDPPEANATPMVPDDAGEPGMSGWPALRSALAAQVSAAVEGPDRRILPLGKWLADDLVVAAVEASGGVARQAALRLGMSATTFRRRMLKARALIDSGLAPRPRSWERVRGALESVVRSPEVADEELLGRAERMLLEEVLARTPDQIGLRAALLGVTIPTFRRRLDEVSESGSRS